MKNISKIAQFLIELSKEAHIIMLKYYSPLGILAEEKEDLSPVTQADIEINEMVIKRVQENYSEYEILAEEISTDISKSNKLFVCDPLDGTHMFKIGATMFGFSCAVVINGVPVAGVISNPLAKRTLIAEKDKGAYLVETGDKISVSDTSTLDKALIKTGWKDTRLSSLLHKEGTRTPEVYSIVEAGALVALGGFDGAVHTGHFPHDIAGLKIVVEEAGGTVTDIDGNEQRYDKPNRGAIISNKKLHEKLLSVVIESGINKDLPINNK